MLDVNIKGSIFMSQAVFPYLKTRGGTIINFGSDIAAEPCLCLRIMLLRRVLCRALLGLLRESGENRDSC